MMKIKRSLSGLLGALLLFCASGAPRAQEAAPVVTADDAVLRVRTRVVSLDALIKDKRTKQPVTDLTRDNFEVRADGQPRQLTYFSREGDAGRKPLALVLAFDLERLGAGRFLRRTEILQAMANELGKLPAADEVAVVVLDPGGVEGKREWLTKFTRNRAQLAAALAIVPTLVGEGNGGADAETGAPVSQTAGTAQPAAAPQQAMSAPQADAAAKPDDKAKEQTREKDAAHPDGEVVDVFKDKDGHTVRRIVRPDGHIAIERTNADGSVNVSMDDSDLAAAAWEINRTTARARPNSQAAIVYVTDGIAPMFYAQRDFIATRLLQSNTIFSALVVEMKTGIKLAMPLIKPLGNWVGLSIAGSAQHFARQTGGEVVKVHRPADYAAGLARIVGNLTARYSLGFALAADERDDGQLHPLEVRVRAKDAKGKERKLLVTARTGYYMPQDEPAAQTATRNDAPPQEQ